MTVPVLHIPVAKPAGILRAWAVLSVVLILCGAVLSVWASPARAEPRDRGHRLVFSTFPSGGLSALFNHILTEAYARLGYEIELQGYPAERALFMANEGLVDGEAGRVNVVEREYPMLVRVPTPLYVNRIAVLVGNADIDPAEGWGQFAHHRTCIRNGYKFLESKVKGTSCHHVSSYEKMLELLKNGRVEVALAEYFDILPVLDAQGLNGVRILDRPMASNPMYHYLNRKHAELVPLINDELRRMAAAGRMKEIELHMMREHYGNVTGIHPLLDAAP